jgi:hypothetical protein
MEPAITTTLPKITAVLRVFEPAPETYYEVVSPLWFLDDIGYQKDITYGWFY